MNKLAELLAEASRVIAGYTKDWIVDDPDLMRRIREELAEHGEMYGTPEIGFRVRASGPADSQVATSDTEEITVTVQGLTIDIEYGDTSPDILIDGKFIESAETLVFLATRGLGDQG